MEVLLTEGDAGTLVTIGEATGAGDFGESNTGLETDSWEGKLTGTLIFSLGVSATTGDAGVLFSTDAIVLTRGSLITGEVDVTGVKVFVGAITGFDTSSNFSIHFFALPSSASISIVIFSPVSSNVSTSK